MQVSSNYKPRRNSLKSIEIPHISYTFIVPIIRYEIYDEIYKFTRKFAKNWIFMSSCRILALPENAKSILYESNPCPFTAANVEERLIRNNYFLHLKVLLSVFSHTM